ncbi:hypothetical protein [Candidatus Electronema sp. PJ]|uniref:hypothetical protein n=1 Tax=Candidatus Electronema sp. PJ TaxID=3401572 RepID=UPI003AA994D0
MAKQESCRLRKESCSAAEKFGRVTKESGSATKEFCRLAKELESAELLCGSTGKQFGQAELLACRVQLLGKSAVLFPGFVAHVTSSQKENS